MSARRDGRNYIEAGFDERDGLDTEHGRWMRDTWGVVRWVQTSEPTRVCADCPSTVGPRATRCLPCIKERDRRRHQERRDAA